MCYPEMRKPLLSIVPQFFLLPNGYLGGNLITLLHSSLMRQVQSLELDENCLLSRSITGARLRIPGAVLLTDIRISFWDFDQCFGLLIQLGSQLHSLTVSIAMLYENQQTLISEIQSVSKISLFDM